jgi:hypothetical protein
MERDKLIEILENGSEAELTLIQNYLLDQIIKKMPTEAEAIRRCVETSEKIKDLEAEIMRLKLMVNSLETELRVERGAKTYTTDSTWTTGTSWGDSTITVSGYSATSDCSTTYPTASSNNCATYTSTTII